VEQFRAPALGVPLRTLLAARDEAAGPD